MRLVGLLSLLFFLGQCWVYWRERPENPAAAGLWVGVLGRVSRSGGATWDLPSYPASILFEVFVVLGSRAGGLSELGVVVDCAVRDDMARLVRGEGGGEAPVGVSGRDGLCRVSGAVGDVPSALVAGEAGDGVDAGTEESGAHEDASR